MTEPRSIADVVRTMSPEDLVQLVQLRPDLTRPRPLDLAELVERAGSAASTQRAIEGLDAWQRRVCLALAATEDAITTRRLAALMQAERPDVQHAAEALARRALVWGNERGWHLTRAARAAFGPYPAGLAPASAMPLEDGEIEARLAEVGQAGREVLDLVLWHNPTGRVLHADRRATTDSDRPVDRLLYRRLLRPLDSETIILPREVALRLRGGRLFDDTVPSRAMPWPTPADGATLRRAEQAALGSAFELVRGVETLLETLGELHPRPLATGAIGKRDFAALTAEVGDARGTLVRLMTAQQAGLLASAGSAWLPSLGYDEWLAHDDWQRWLTLRDAWLSLPSWPRLDAPVLAPRGSDTAWAPSVRGLVVEQLHALPQGTPVTAEVLAARIAWLRPGWERLDLPELCRDAVAELGQLGLLGLGLRSSLVDREDDPGFPAAVAEFLVQGDLTAVAPGPLAHQVARPLRLMTERESSGGATVHRFSAASLRRAMDAGWSASRVREWLAEHSATGVPQALDYLVEDVARRHGQVQVAAAASVVTVDDPAVAEALCQRPDAAELGLRRLAPTVLAASADPAELVDFLRSAGLAPIAQDEQGRPRTVAPPRRSRARLVVNQPRPEAPDASALVAELLARDDERRHVRAQAEILETLRERVGQLDWLVIDYVADDGTPRSTSARVMAVSAGTVKLMQKAVGPLTLPVARLMSVRLVT